MSGNKAFLPEKKEAFLSSAGGKDKNGFSMVELLLALAVLSILMAAMIGLFVTLSQSYTTQNAAAGVQQVLRTGIDMMTRHIRMAGYNPLRLTDVGIKADFSQDRIHFSYDLDADGIIAEDEDITFLLEAQKLKRQKRGRLPSTMIDNVTDLRFTYLDADNQPAGNPDDIKSVVVSMTVSAPAGRSRVLSRTYATRVICRNLGL
jgi:prepilin-type N-terminal cleavage/methylation domain-containing protein